MNQFTHLRVGAVVALAVAGCLSVATGWATAAEAGGPSNAAREILAFEKARREAVVRKDLKALDDMSARDLVYVDAGGFERKRADYIDHIKVEDVHYASYALDDTKAEVFGDIAVETGLFRFDVTANGRQNIGAQYFTSVYVREGGRWKLLVWHPTKAKN